MLVSGLGHVSVHLKPRREWLNQSALLGSCVSSALVSGTSTVGLLLELIHAPKP